MLKRENIFSILAFLLGFTLPVGTAPANIIIPCVSLIGLICIDRQRLYWLLRQPIIRIALVLFIALGFGVLYSDTPHAIRYFIKYRKLLFLFFITIYLTLYSDQLKYMLFGFLAGNAFILLFSILTWVGNQQNWFIILFRSADHIAKNAIAQSFIMAIASFLAVFLSFKASKYWRIALRIFALLALFSIFAISRERTAYLAAFLFISICLWTMLPRQLRGWGCLLGFVLLWTLWTIPNPVTYRFQQGIQEIRQCATAMQQPIIDRELCNTSMGQRTYFMTSALDEIRQRLWFGHGTGAIGIFFGDNEVHNPHNEYLMQGLQLGIIGILLYIALLVCSFLQAARLDPPWSTAYKSIILVYGIGSLFNSLLMDMTEGNTLIILLSAMLALQWANRSTTN